jgi:putative flippase GtrA
VTHLARKLFRFGVVGGVCVGLNVFVFWVLVDKIGVDYLIVTAIAFFLVGSFGYFLNRIWTFDSRDGGIATELSRFFFVQALLLVASLACMRVLVGTLGLNVLAACVVQSAIFTAATFAAHSVWTFRGAK